MGGLVRVEYRGGRTSQGKIQRREDYSGLQRVIQNFTEGNIIIYIVHELGPQRTTKGACRL